MSDFNSKGSMKMKRNLSFSLISKQTEEVKVLMVLLKKSKKYPGCTRQALPRCS